MVLFIPDEFLRRFEVLNFYDFKFGCLKLEIRLVYFRNLFKIYDIPKVDHRQDHKVKNRNQHQIENLYEVLYFYYQIKLFNGEVVSAIHIFLKDPVSLICSNKVKNGVNYLCGEQNYTQNSYLNVIFAYQKSF